MPVFHPGDRVTATIWGEVRTGTVAAPEDSRPGGIVWVHWHGHRGRPMWVHHETLSHLPT